MSRFSKIFFFIFTASLLVGSLFFVSQTSAVTLTGDEQKILLELNHTLDKVQRAGQARCGNGRYEYRGGKRACKCTVSVTDTEGEKPINYELLFCVFPSVSDSGRDYVKSGPGEGGVPHNSLIFESGIFGGYNIRVSNTFYPDDPICKIEISSSLRDSPYKVSGADTCKPDYFKRPDGKPWKPDGCQCTSPGLENSLVDFTGRIWVKKGELDIEETIAEEKSKGQTFTQDLFKTVFGVDYDSPDAYNRVNAIQKNRMCPHDTGGDWNCSQPAYAEGERCCCTREEGAGGKLTCTTESGFKYGGKCPNNIKPLPVPAGGSCNDIAVEDTKDRGLETLPPGISVESLMEKARGLNELKNFEGPSQLIGQGIRIILSFIGSIALILYIFAGFLWMTAAGNPERVTSAKNIIIWATLGVAIMLGSYIIVQFLFGTVLGAGS